MQEHITVTGLVLKTQTIAEYDKRVVILTKERGKITTFARGAKKMNNKFMASTSPFCYGEFKLYAGKHSYQILDASISNYFEQLRLDIEDAYYGMHFLEIMDYFTRENNDEKEMLRLLYQSLRAVGHTRFANELVRCIFEIKALMINGEYPGVPKGGAYLDSTLYTMNYIYESSIEKLYTFVVNEEVLKELIQITQQYKRDFYDQTFQSLEILKTLEKVED